MMTTEVKLKPDTTLVGAFSRQGDYALRTEDTGLGDLWAWGDNPYGGPSVVVRASSFEKALNAVYDLLPTVKVDELHEAYGFDTDEEFQRAAEAADGDHPLELIEGYYHQANCSGTGIVSVDPCERLWRFTSDDAESVRLVIRHHDDV